ncbi:MAG: HEAT repeat domain-containing protein [Deltaproteobacteria bacterium]|nr:MAG: HEAT repeat domain-containing protein [Deltaproteobacteria bacterium]
MTVITPRSGNVRCARRHAPAAAAVLLAAVMCACSRDHDTHPPAPSPSVAPTPRRTATGFSDAGLGSRIAVLDAPNGSDEAKVAVIEGLAADRGEAATAVLVRFVDSPSTLIAAASIKGLTNRGCDRVEGVLVRLLESGEWQRRAWAAKVLAANGCRGARPSLAERARREVDERVKARLDEAMQQLAEGG